METHAERIKYIRSTVPEAERLAILAEEATELAHAALKLRRTLVPGNPTPITYERALRGLLEEFADVKLCMSVLRLKKEDISFTEREFIYKARRWVERLLSESCSNSGSENLK